MYVSAYIVIASIFLSSVALMSTNRLGANTPPWKGAAHSVDEAVSKHITVRTEVLGLGRVATMVAANTTRWSWFTSSLNCVSTVSGRSSYTQRSIGRMTSIRSSATSRWSGSSQNVTLVTPSTSHARSAHSRWRLVSVCRAVTPSQTMHTHTSF